MNGLIVVDTNVPIIANRGEDVSNECYEACVAAVRDVVEDRRRIAVDDGWRIIAEYMHKLQPKGQRGWGDQFLKWVLNNQATGRVELVAIKARDEASADFEEFPGVPTLESFDRSDRKFVAVANAHPERPPILQALDSKWWGWNEALLSVGITVEFLCPSEIKATYEKKFGDADHD